MRSARVGRLAGVLTLLLVAAMGTGCFSNVNSGQTLPEGGSAWTFGFGRLMHEDIDVGIPSIIWSYRLAPTEGWEFGVSNDLVTLTMFLRHQFLAGEEHGLDAALEFGFGFLGPWTTGYAGVAVSKEFEGVSPYLHFRYTAVDFDAAEFGLTEDTSSIKMVSAGARIAVGENFALIPEVAYLQEVDDLVVVNFAFQFGKNW